MPFDDEIAETLPYIPHEFPNGYNQEFGPEVSSICEKLFDPSFIKVKLFYPTFIIFFIHVIIMTVFILLFVDDSLITTSN